MIRVLIVDDDKLARKGLISIMPWSSYDMEVAGEAANGLKALEFLALHKVDLMFVDLSMPVLSGIELMQQARILYPDLHFVVLTFHEDFDYVQSCIRLGAIDYISKLKMETEDYNSIFERIAQRLSLKRQQNTAQEIPSPSGNGNRLIQDVHAPGGSFLHESDIGKWTQIEQEWKELFWLYDDILFDRLCKETETCGMPMQAAAMLLAKCIVRAEEATRIKVKSAMVMDTIRAAVAEMRNYRDTVHAYAACSNDLTETAICMLKCVQFIHDGIAEPLHTDMVASHVNMSRTYFCQCFKKVVGHTFNEYLRQKRIHLAKQFLSNTHQSISWISQAVGYGDIKYFSHVFREQVHMMPSEYRLKSLGEGK